MTRVISIGLDGAAWHKLDQLIDEGHLPNIEALTKQGVRAPLRTTHPPVTCPAWRCSTSGKNPGKVGVFWWLQFNRETGRTHTPNSTTFDTADIWDYLSDEGRHCAVINVPMTYPPTKINGTMVSGFGAPFEIDASSSPITFPSEYQSELLKEYDWQIGVDNITTPDGLEQTYDVIRSRFELLLDLLEKDYDYLHLTVFYINMLQHKYGDGPETTRGWEIIDKYLGKICEADGLLLLYSDHGHSTIESTFAINRWLIERGYLKLDTGTSDQLSEQLYSLVSKSGISPKNLARHARKFLPSRFVNSLIASSSPISTSELSNKILWNESKAFALSQGPLYLNRNVLGNEYESFKNTLKSELVNISYEGKSVISEARFAPDIYSGQYTDEGPDMMLISNDGWEIYGGVVPTVFETQATSWTSGNHPVGILLMNGPGIATVELPEQSILDVAPTILEAMDCAVPTDIDGEPIHDAFEGSVAEYEIRDPLPSGGDFDQQVSDKLEQRLEDLGYLE